MDQHYIAMLLIHPKNIMIYWVIPFIAMRHGLHMMQRYYLQTLSGAILNNGLLPLQGRKPQGIILSILTIFPYTMIKKAICLLELVLAEPSAVNAN